MTLIFQKGDHVCYGMNGICLIEDIREMSVGRAKDTFYVLRPLRDRHSTFFIPTGNDLLVQKMRVPIMRDEIDTLIASAHAGSGAWIDDRKERMEVFRGILHRADPCELLRLCAVLYNQKCFLSETGKRMAPSDESVLKQAEDLTKNEFGFVMDMSADKAGEYLKNRLTSG